MPGAARRRRRCCSRCASAWHCRARRCTSMPTPWPAHASGPSAAGHEAMGDKRLLAEEDVFFYELEEMKQMMTGEWNISDMDNIRATAAQRKLDYARLAAGSRRATCSSATARCLPTSLAVRQGCPVQAGRGRGAVVDSGGSWPVWRDKRRQQGDLGRRAGGWRLGGGTAGRRRNRAGTRFAARSGCRRPRLRCRFPSSMTWANAWQRSQAQNRSCVDGSQGTVTNGR